MKTRLLSLLVVSLVSLGSSSCQNDEELTENISSPVEAKIHPWDWEPEESHLIAGRAIYLQECALCHDEGEEGAPALTHVRQWEKRAVKGLDLLVENAINGFVGEDGKMPARGGTETLTDLEVRNAVEYMVATPK